MDRILIVLKTLSYRNGSKSDDLDSRVLEFGRKDLKGFMKELERIRNVNAEGKEWLGMEKQMKKDWVSESVGESEEHPTSLSIRPSSADGSVM